MVAGQSDLVFSGGECVRLVGDHPDDGFLAGDAGYVWGVYPFDPPLYEADFYDQEGNGRAMMFLADEVELVSDISTVNISAEVHLFWNRR